MPRAGREQSGTGIYHVMLRGINRQDIFEESDDYQTFINILSGVQAKLEDDLTTRITTSVDFEEMRDRKYYRFSAIL